MLNIPLGIDERKDPLLSIGVFSRRSRLSMKALRLYDRLGLTSTNYELFEIDFVLKPHA